MLQTKRKPVSVGEMLVEEFMEPMGISQTELAEMAGLPRKHVNELCRNRRAVTADTALILGRVFGNSADFWLNTQRRMDLWEALNTPKRLIRIERAKPIGRRVQAVGGPIKLWIGMFCCGAFWRLDRPMRNEEFWMSKRVWSRVLGGAGVGLMLVLGGCGGGFFIDPTTTTTPTSSGDYVYVANQTTNTLSGFVVGSSVLTATTGSPYALLSGLAGASVAVTRPNTYVYVGGSGAIECFSIGTGGVLTLVNSSAASAAANFVSLDTSPDGKWLIALDSTTQTLYVYGINTSTGALSLTATLVYSAPGAGTAVPRSVRISPNGLYIIATLATGGDTIFTFTTATGVPVQAATLALASGVSDNAVTFDSSSAYVYFARGGSTAGASGVASYSVGSGGSLTAVQTLAVAGSTPYSVLLDSTGGYAYTANRGDGTVSGFSVASGTLTALSGSPYASGLLAQALVADNSKKYVIAASFGGSSDLTMYSFDAITLGKLDPVAVIASGADPAGSVALAATH